MRKRSVYTRHLLGLMAAALTIPGTPASVFAQYVPVTHLDLRVTSALLTQAATSGGQAAGAQPAAPGQTRRLTIEEAVKLALEHNLGIQIARYDPRAQDLTVASAKAAWAPSFTNTFQKNSQDSPNNNFLAGSLGGKTSQAAFSNSAGLQQNTPWGGNYSASWDGSRSTTNSNFSTFSPQVRSGLSFSAVQPLMRNFGIDSLRQQVSVSLKNREISDIELQQTVATTMRTVRNAYWNLAYATASLSVQRQSLELAQQSLRDTRARVEIGTTPPIDIVEAESEVATREEAVIVAEAAIKTAEDNLRALVFDPSAPDFWTMTIEAVDLPPFQPISVDTDGAVRNALQKRTDLQRQSKSLEVNDVNIRYLRNQTLPDVSAQFDYGLTGLGGLNLIRGPGPFGPGSGSVIDTVGRSYGATLGDLFANRYPQWTAQLNISYPIGASQQEANLARARIEFSQAQTQLKNQQLQVSTQVREAARQVQTNQKRVETTRAARSFAERRLEAEQRKFAAGTSTSFIVFQAQRDLALARNNELKAILDYNQSVVDLETVQEVPLTATAPR
ncbi:MAG TPA: TolC family protein [Vicinamibacterales bacterium]|jgi:HAE1 family hydrophobic/amphiphilic exporter-1|nr:TolC family protein [Vicinamibacterales bacterium]